MHHGPRRGPPPPPAVRANTATGSIELTVHQPPHLGTITKALSHTGDITINGARTFRGMYRAGTHVGAVTVEAKGNKTIEVIKQVTRGPGEYQVGFVNFKHEGNHTEKACPRVQAYKDWSVHSLNNMILACSYRRHKLTSSSRYRAAASEEDLIEGMLEKPSVEADHDDRNRGPHGPPPHEGPHGHHGPSGAPGHHGPHGPHGPGGPPPPPRGMSKVIAVTDVGAVTLNF